MGKQKERDKFEDLGIDGRIILKRIYKKWNGSMNWNVLAKDTDRC